MRLLDLLARIVRWPRDETLEQVECECRGTGIDPDDDEGVCHACEDDE